MEWFNREYRENDILQKSEIYINNKVIPYALWNKGAKSVLYSDAMHRITIMFPKEQNCSHFLPFYSL